MSKFSLYTDGGARGNPGPAGIGVVLKDAKGETIKEISKYIGKTTNNVAEYTALIEGLKTAADKNVEEINCYLDSMLVVKQLKGEFKVKNENIRTYWSQVKVLETKFKRIEYFHVYREKNKEADYLVNEALDRAN